MIVIDASVAVKWVVVEPGHELALALALSSLAFAAPSVFVPELVNVLRKKLIRREISAEQAKEATAKAIGLIRQFVDINAMSDDLMALSIALNHPAYDCCYILAAKQTGMALVTADGALERKAREAGVRAFGLAEWSKAAE